GDLRQGGSRADSLYTDAGNVEIDRVAAVSANADHVCIHIGVIIGGGNRLAQRNQAIDGDVISGAGHRNDSRRQAILEAFQPRAGTSGTYMPFGPGVTLMRN